MKTKDYVALCIAKNPVTQKCMDKINQLGEILLNQKTPIRVLHRRPIAIRKKGVHKIEAKLIPGICNYIFL